MAGKIEWQLNLDAAGFHKAINGAERAVKNLAAGFTAYLSVKSIVDQFGKSLELGSKLTDMSAKTGIGAGALYDLGEAGRVAGLSLDDITHSISKMQKGLGTSETSGVLAKLGLNGTELASAKPDLAFKKIGQAINALKNPTDQVQAAMALFGKSGAQMLQLFNDPAFKEGIGNSQAAQLLEKNAAVFDRLDDAITRVGPKINEFFVGFDSENAANIERIAAVMEKLNLTQAGVDAGTIVATFTQSIANGQFGNMLWLSMQIAAGKFSNAIIGGALFMGRVLWETISAIVSPSTWQSLGNVLMSFVNSFNATLLQGIATLLRQSEKIPKIGKYFSGAANGAESLAADYAATAAAQSNSGFSGFGKIFPDIVKKAFESYGWGEVFDVSGLDSQLQELTDSIYAGVVDANKKAQDANNLDKKNGNYEALTSKASIVADSFAKVGGGGTSSFLGVLDVNRQQLQAQNQTNRLLEQYLKGSGGFSAAQLAH
jgi:hypothetical protein